jgi:hypothetical protein
MAARRGKGRRGNPMMGDVRGEKKYDEIQSFYG